MILNTNHLNIRMSKTPLIVCPVGNCEFEGSLSQTIKHVNQSDNEDHTWRGLGYQNSYEYREAIKAGERSSSTPENHPASGVDVVSNQGDDRGSQARQTDEQTGPSRLEIETRYPHAMMDMDRWLLWKSTGDGRKIPRAPWSTGDPNVFVDGMNPDNWQSYKEARRWRSKLPGGFELAFTLSEDDDIVFIDLDDVVSELRPTPEAVKIIEQADSYAALSSSGSGIHIFVRGGLSENSNSLVGKLEEGTEQTVEVYDKNRFVALTGDHLKSTVADLNPSPGLIEGLENKFARVSKGTPVQASGTPRHSRRELMDMDETDDIRDVFDAINQTRPGDISLRSTVTREHSDGSSSLDPSWVHSKSGTRLAAVGEHWIYRQGMIALNALQVVALEEGIISDEEAYPEGADFWAAVDELRARGANIPQYEPSGEETDEVDMWTLTKHFNYGQQIRFYIDPRERTYMERVSLRLARQLIDTGDALELEPRIMVRAADVYVKAQVAGIVPGGALETTLAAAVRIAGIEAGRPSPLKAIADVFDEDIKSIRNKQQRIVAESSLSTFTSALDIIVEPIDYVPYFARQLKIEHETELLATVRSVLEAVPTGSGTNPADEASAAFYAVMKEDDDFSITQAKAAEPARCSNLAIRDKYKKYANLL